MRRRRRASVAILTLLSACGGSPIEASSISASGTSGGDDATMTADDSVSASLTEPTMSASAEDPSAEDPTVDDATAEDPSADDTTAEDSSAGDSSAGDASNGTTTMGSSDDAGTTTDECVATDEVCDAVDNDCDGVVDEGSAANPACGNCGFVPAADGVSYFALCTDFVTWDDARMACGAFGAGVDLAIIDDDGDQAALILLALVDTWIGVSLAEEGHWVWVDGSDSIADGVPVGYDGWALGQPEGGGQNCGELDPLQLGWADAECTQLQSYVCRHPA
jgi:hypothetical protein